MKKLILTKCKICNETKTSRGLSQHIQKSHNISLTDYIVKFEFNVEHPRCLCGCGDITKCSFVVFGERKDINKLVVEY